MLSVRSKRGSIMLILILNAIYRRCLRTALNGMATMRALP